MPRNHILSPPFYKSQHPDEWETRFRQECEELMTDYECDNILPVPRESKLEPVDVSHELSIFRKVASKMIFQITAIDVTRWKPTT